MRVRIRDLSAGMHRQLLQEPAGSLGLDEEQYHFTKPVRADCSLQKVGEQILCRARVTTSIELECSRCLEPREEEISEGLTLLIALSGPPDQAGADPEVMVVQPGDQEVDLSEEVRQTVLLAIPKKPLCRADCLGLCPQCGTNLNLKRCHCQRKAADSRWSALQKLLSNKPKGEASGPS